jgi:hypothetical protein
MQGSRWTAAVAGLALLLVAERAWACAACGNPSLPMQPGGSGAMAGGSGTFGVSLRGLAMQVTHPAGCADLNNCDEVPVQELHDHQVLLAPVELGLSGEWAFDDKWGVEASLPVRSVWASVSYQTPDGADYEPVDADVHHRDETVAGLADGRLMARYGRSLGGVWVAARLGTTVPLGATEEDPFSAGDVGKKHQHIQLGSGAFEPVMSLDATWGGISQQTTAYVTLQQPLYANDKGFEAGRRLLAGAQVGWKAAPDLLLSLLGEVGHEGGEQWQGVVRSDGMTGLTEVRTGAALLWRSEAVTLTAAVRVPVYRVMEASAEEPGEVISPASLSLGATLPL